MEDNNSSKCANCYLRKDCDEMTGSICKFNNFCKYLPDSNKTKIEKKD